MRRIICALLLLFCFSCKKSNGTESKPENYTIFPDIIFGIDIQNLTSKKVVQILREKNIPFNGFNTYGETVKADDPINNPLCIETTFFIGSGIDHTNILRVIYNFIPFNDSNEISLEISNSYYESLLNFLKKKFGPYNKKYYSKKRIIPGWFEDDHSRYSLSWLSNPKLKSSIELIAIDKFIPMTDGFGLKRKSKDSFYLLIRSSAKELEHGKFHPYEN